MRENLFALLRTLMFAVFVPALALSLVACEPEDGEGIGEDGEVLNDTTSVNNGIIDDDTVEDTIPEIAVTGLVDKFGCTYADISGYANINLLPVASGNPVIGVELVEAKDEAGDSAVQSITTLLIGNIFTVSFSNLSPATEYKYRSFVTYGGKVYYGSEYKTFTTKEAPEGAIDLGLSVLWASCNVGADSPEEYGDYFAWGETQPNGSCDESNSITYGLSISRLKSQGIIDADGNLTAEYDAATANLGKNWRMPTLDEIKELIDECTWGWISVNGVDGLQLTGRNGNSIFLPTAGSRYGESVHIPHSGDTYYWSATLYSSSSKYAYYLYFDDGSYGDGATRHRYYGHPVRPVAE